MIGYTAPRSKAAATSFPFMTVCSSSAHSSPQAPSTIPVTPSHRAARLRRRWQRRDARLGG